MKDIEKKIADNERAYIQGLITLEEYEKNKSELEKIEFNELKKIVENIFGSNEGEQYDKDW